MYLRDKRSPRPKNETVSRVMSANRAKDTLPEIVLRRMLWQAGARGYRLHYKRVPGRPDIAFVSKRVAIFVNGCYWHHCPKCNYPLPKTNTVTIYNSQFTIHHSPFTYSILDYTAGLVRILRI